MSFLLPRLTKHGKGFGLVEIMVALVIGMLAVIIMLQVFAQSEERKRLSTTGGDAQTSGTIAFRQIQNDLAQAGFGISVLPLLNCPLTWKLPSGTSISHPITLAPVTINPSVDVVPLGDPNTDTLLIVYGNGSGQPQGETGKIIGTEYGLDSLEQAQLFTVGTRVIAGPANQDSCPPALVLDTVTQSNALTGAVTVATGATGAALFNLGTSPRILAYRIWHGNLTVCDYVVSDCGKDSNKDDTSIWAPISSNIVSMKAVYLKDTSTPMDNIVDAHDQTTPTAAACDWIRISAINVALVARSAQYNKDMVVTSTMVPTWSDDANTTAPIVAANGALGPNVPNADEDWKHYRYRVFEATTPLRNVGWYAAAGTGC